MGLDPRQISNFFRLVWFGIAVSAGFVALGFLSMIVVLLWAIVAGR